MARPDAPSDEPYRARVKICGLTSVDDARRVLDAGPDAVGINMVAGPRQVTADVAGAIVSAITTAASSGDKPTPCPVLLARVTDDRLDDEVERVIQQAGVQWLQLYGEVTARAIRSQLDAGRRPVPVVRVGGEDFAASFDEVLEACGRHRPPAVLLDAYHRDKLGGTGQPFRWSWVVEARERGRLDGWPPIVLAGGLNPQNVAQAVQAVRPWAVDVSSGVEADPGRKDPVKVAEFIRNARNAVPQGSA